MGKYLILCYLWFSLKYILLLTYKGITYGKYRKNKRRKTTRNCHGLNIAHGQAAEHGVNYEYNEKEYYYRKKNSFEYIFVHLMDPSVCYSGSRDFHRFRHFAFFFYFLGAAVCISTVSAYQAAAPTTLKTAGPAVSYADKAAYIRSLCVWFC